MKLRIRGNSIRLRLGQSEVAQLAETGRVNDFVRFSAVPESRLTYTLQSSSSAPAISASLSGGEMTITVPEGQAREWADTDLVGLEHAQPIDGEECLSIVIEKDFQCLARQRNEDQSDNFPNPLVGKRHSSRH